jgi:hypothetical protein
MIVSSDEEFLVAGDEEGNIIVYQMAFASFRVWGGEGRGERGEGRGERGEERRGEERRGEERRGE